MVTAQDPESVEDCSEDRPGDEDVTNHPRGNPGLDTRAARLLAAQALTHVGRASGRRPLRDALCWITRGRVGARRGWPIVPELGTPWQDTIAGCRSGWRQRTGWIDGEQVFGVDYRICRRCGLGWIEEPHTYPQYRRCGVAAAAFAALRHDHPGLERHTLGDHTREHRRFWDLVGADVPGGYSWRKPCQHIYP